MGSVSGFPAVTDAYGCVWITSWEAVAGLMVKLLLYGYANGVMSSRRLEAATYRDVAVRMLCAGQHPDFCVIARFRKRHLAALAGLPLSDYLIREVRKIAEQPTPEEMRERLRQRDTFRGKISPTDILRAERDSR